MCPAPDNAVDCIPSDGTSHSIGSVRSAADGTLWVGSGDAASFTEVDPLAFRTYDERSMAGKILHVDRNGDGLPGHPLCTANTNLDHVCTKVWAGGFRNPFRFKLRPGGLTIGDVGWGEWEEIDLISTTPGTGGRYYGWPCYEGNHRQGSYQARPECPPQYAKEGTPQAHVPPSYEHQHSGGGAVIGGPTYSGPYPVDYQGDIFFGDYAQRFVKKLNVNSAGVVTSVENFATNWPGVDLELSPGGELVWADIGGGAIRKVVYTPGNASPIARLDANPTSGPAPLDVSFSGSRSSDPDGDPLSYSWEFGDGGTSSQATPTHRYASAGTYIARLTVRDGRGGVGTDTETISAGNTPPALQVSGATTYRAGAPFQLQASVTDTQDQPFPGSRVSWDVRVVHGTHEHFIGTASGASLSQTAITDHDADSFYRIVVSATDSGGLQDTETRELRPQTTTVRLRSNPSGAPLAWAGRSLTAPRDLVTAIGFRTIVSANSPFQLGGAIFDFSSWSNGGAQIQSFTVPASGAELMANYRRRGGAPATPPRLTPTRRPPAPEPPADTTGPELELFGVNAARGRIRGSAADESGVESVDVALRRRFEDGRCSWWLKRKRRMSRPRSCARRLWMETKLTPSGDGVRWLRLLRRSLPPGGYRVLVRAADREGNETRLPVTGESLIRVER